MGLELKDLEGKIKKLREEKNLLQNDMTYLEKVIREELGFVKPGEMVYKLVPENKTKTASPAAAAKSTSQQAR